jgi:hypothetical protein
MGRFRAGALRGGGVIYAVKENGDLLYYRDEARNGKAAWAFDGVGQKISSGFAAFARLFPGETESSMPSR